MATLTQARRPTPNHVRRAALPAASEPVEERELNEEGLLRVDLDGALEGYHLLVDPEELNFGMVEDLNSGDVTAVITALATAIVGGDLPKGVDRAGLRRLKPKEAKAVMQGVGSVLDLTKS